MLTTFWQQAQTCLPTKTSHKFLAKVSTKPKYQPNHRTALDYQGCHQGHIDCGKMFNTDAI
jgi:hypothetical protein